jgi:hypothetical protein
VESSAGNLTLRALGASSDAALSAGRDVLLSDARFASLPLSDASAGATGGSAFVSRLSSPPSLIAAINRAAGLGGKDFRFGRKFHAGGVVTAGNNVPGGSFFDFTTQPGEDASVFFDGTTPANQNVFVAFNGRRLATGNAGTPNDVRLGTTPANGDLIFAFTVRNDDFIEAFAHVSSTGTA